jgi:hypothetical protein
LLPLPATPLPARAISVGYFGALFRCAISGVHIIKGVSFGGMSDGSATVCSVRVNLRHGEPYERSMSYEHQKEIIKSTKIFRGKDIIWDSINQIHKFSDPLTHEKMCVEIVLNKDGRPSTAFHVWSPGTTKEDLRYCNSFLFNRSWLDSDGRLWVKPGDTIELRFIAHDPVSAQVPVQTASSVRLRKLLRDLEDN